MLRNDFPPIIFQLFFPFSWRSIAFLVSFAFSKQAVLAVTICSPDPGSPCSSAPAPPDWRCSCLHWHTPLSPFSNWTSAGLRTLWSYRVCGQQSGTEQSLSDTPATPHQDGEKPATSVGLPLDNSGCRVTDLGRFGKFFLDHISVAPRVWK